MHLLYHYPILSVEAALEYFCAELNLHANPESGVEMQRALMAYRASWPELSEHPVVLFMHFLYRVFPQVKHPSPSVSDSGTQNLPLLDEAIVGARFINQMPYMASTQAQAAATHPKIDYLEQQKQRKRIGNRGEAIVLNMEKKRLQEAGRPDLANKIQHVADNTDREGYDILSYDSDGTPRYIEVKATTANNLERGFYISGNELEKSTLLPNYYLYLVFAATSKKPKILPIKAPKLTSTDYELAPMAYHVTITSRVAGCS